MTRREVIFVWAFLMSLLAAFTIMAWVGRPQEPKPDLIDEEAANRTLNAVGIAIDENGMVVQQ